MREKLILVTDFATLRAGDLVVVKRCPCLATHRGFLSKRVNSAGRLFDGSIVPPQGMWIVIGDNGHGGDIYAVSEGTVNQRKVYLIDPFAEQTETTERAEPKPLERVR